jgi:hypothetical protein
MTVTVRTMRALLAAGLGVAASGLMPTATFAGSGNIIVIEQRGSNNTLSADQSSATGSQIGGIELTGSPSNDPEAGFNILGEPDLLTSPALQSGEGNEADVRVSGQGGAVYLLQNNDGSLLGNSAEIILDADQTFAAISQIGEGNTAEIEVTGALSSGSVLQNGDGNFGRIEVPIADTEARLVQNGDNIEATLVVEGVTGGNVDFQIFGNNVTQPGGALVVNTNGASVSITQTEFTD